MRFLSRRWRSSPVGIGGVLAAALVTSARRARADPDVDLRTFRPSTDHAGTLATEPVYTPGPWNVQFGQWFSFATTSLNVRDPDGREVRVVGPQVVGDPTFSLGLGRRTAIGATLPLLLGQAGDASSFGGGRAPSRFAVGDATVTGKVAIVLPDAGLGGYGVAFLTRFSLPTGDRSSLISDGGATGEGRLLVTYDPGHIVFVGLTAGYRYRWRRHTIVDIDVEDSIPWGVSLGYAPLQLRSKSSSVTFFLEGHGEVGAVPNPLFRDARVSPALVGASARWELGPAWMLFSGIETGLTSAFGAPRARLVLAITYAPTIIDTDHDGIPDDVDECVGLEEDYKGEHPRDGCPDFSSDIGPSPTPPPAGESGPPPPAPRR